MLLQFMPSPFTLTPDPNRTVAVDNVVSEAAKAEGRTLQGIGIQPEPIEAIVPSYLWRFRKSGQFRNPDGLRNGVPSIFQKNKSRRRRCCRR